MATSSGRDKECTGQYGWHAPTPEHPGSIDTPLVRHEGVRLKVVQALPAEPCIGVVALPTFPWTRFHMSTAILYDPARLTRVPQHYPPAPPPLPGGIATPLDELTNLPHPCIIAARRPDGSIGTVPINADLSAQVEDLERLITAWREEVIAPEGPVKLKRRPVGSTAVDYETYMRAYDEIPKGMTRRADRVRFLARRIPTDKSSIYRYQRKGWPQ